MNSFEKFCLEKPATITVILVVLISICLSIFAGIPAGFLTMGILLVIVLFVYWVRKSESGGW